MLIIFLRSSKPSGIIRVDPRRVSASEGCGDRVVVNNRRTQHSRKANSLTRAAAGASVAVLSKEDVGPDGSQESGTRGH
jgi:hypothetical protein